MTIDEKLQAKKKVGRKKEIPPEKWQEIEKQVEAYASFDCTWKEISAILGYSEDIMMRYFTPQYHKGKQSCKIRLRQSLYKAAFAGNITAAIFLSKQVLGYSDKIENKNIDETDTKQLIEDVKKALKEMDEL